MPDGSAKTNRLLAEVLEAIKKVDLSLHTHERRIRDLEATRESEGRLRIVVT